ncbi:YppG family protein [Bacillus sp. DJP31]|uniref:YppG family protein n=1 Tax=Bacillus sp. DJP31 TaxID=3409789 RepID=UPI003BB7F7BC
MFGLKQKRRMVRNPFMGQSPYFPYQNNPYNQSFNPQNMYNTSYMMPNQPYINPSNIQQQPYVNATNFHQQPYVNPSQVQQQPYVNQQQGFVPFQMPYPNQKVKTPQIQPGGVQSIMKQFKTKEGGYDVNKMMNTAGQMMSTMNQIGGMVKQVGSMFKVKV